MKIDIYDECKALISFYIDVFFLQIAKRLKDSVQGLGQSLTVLVQTAGNIQANPSDPFAKRELSENAKKVAEKVRISSEAGIFKYFSCQQEMLTL